MSIPKVIHYFWFGKNELPELAKKCLKSWQKMCPEYEIKLWNEDNFDVHCVPFVEQAYEAKKYAFVTDYARFYILNQEGGVYIETDTELLKPIDRFLEDRMFLGIGKDDVTVCVFGMEKNHPISHMVLDYYNNRQFTLAPNVYDMTTVNAIVHNILIENYGLVHKDEYQKLNDGICIYPTKLFLTDWTYGTLNSKESVAFHYADGSWLTPELRDQKKIILKCVKVFGKKLGWNIGNVIYYLKYNGFRKTLDKCLEKIYSRINPWYVDHCIFTINKKKIMVSNFNGKGYGFDPKYIVDKLIQEGNYTIYWAVKDKHVDNKLPENVKAVRINSLMYYYHLSTSKVWIDDVRKGSEIRKRNGQYYLQTWHGSIPLKKLEKDIMHTLSKNYIEDAIHDSAMIDAIPSSCGTRTELIKRSFWYDGEVLEVGCPRNDIFFKSQFNMEKKEIYKKLGINENDKIVVYAPTFRQDNSLDAYNLDFESVKVALEKRFGGNYKCVVRLHPNLSDIDIHEIFGSEVLDGMQFEDAQKLFAVCDVLISDYSDCLFETALSGKPVFIYASDVSRYMNERDFYLQLEDLPFKVAETNKKMVENIEKFNLEEYSKNLKTFWKSQQLFESGHATEKLAKWVMDKCI